MDSQFWFVYFHENLITSFSFFFFVIYSNKGAHLDDVVNEIYLIFLLVLVVILIILLVIKA